MKKTNGKYADILMPLARGLYSYRLGGELEDNSVAGMCVEVVLGTKHYTGIIWKLYDTPPDVPNIRTVTEPIPGSPFISENQRKLWEWIAGYYMCALGEVMRAALPSALKPKGFSHEQLAASLFRPATTAYYSLHPRIDTEEKLNEILETLLRKSKGRYRAMMEFCTAAGEDVFHGRVPRKALGTTSTVLKALTGKDILVLTETEDLPFEGEVLHKTLPDLTPAQQLALEGIKGSFGTKDTVLLHGVTGCGKTEIYVHLAAEQLAAGKNVLYLLPEIAMTAQLIDRLTAYFGSRVITYHSSYNERKRTRNYLRANKSGESYLLVGTRSAVFPLAGNTGLVIVDEEHDPAFKNSETSPRFNARDTAMMMASLAGAKVLLGSATPSVESYSNAVSGKYGLVTLRERYGNAQLPRMIISDSISAAKRGERKTHFNKLLLDEISAALAEGSQVMLYQNRRGFSPYVECGECGWTAGCPHCNVSLTLHRAEGNLTCHYCGHKESIPHKCPACGLPAVNPKGFGTEKVEDELSILFPEARIARLDRDTATSPSRYSAIINSFSEKKTDILIGTQMITKGYDFPGVTVAAILNADNLLAFPDFRASERAFQIITQFSGRAGRREAPGKVIIQTSQPEHPVIKQSAAMDYHGMFRTQLSERQTFFYPPFCKMVTVTLRHKDRQLLQEGAVSLGNKLRHTFGRRVSGPVPPSVDRVRGLYILNFVIKIEKDKSFHKARELLAKILAAFAIQSKYRSIIVRTDVDPQ